MSFKILPNLIENEQKRIISKGLKPLKLEELNIYGRTRMFHFSLQDNLDIDSNTVLLFGQCLTKDNEYEENPISIADAIFARLFSQLALQFPNSMVVYPDSEYERYSRELRMRRHDASKLDKVTTNYENFHRSILPKHVRLLRTSQYDKFLEGMKDRFTRFVSSATSFYGWRTPTEKQKELVYECAVNELVLPYLLFGGKENILIFAYPDEICSVKVAQQILCENNYLAKGISLLSPMPIKGINSRKDMVDTSREKRLHMHENQEAINEKYQLMMACNTTVPDDYIHPDGCEMFYLLNHMPHIRDSTIANIRRECPYIGRLCHQIAMKYITDFSN